MRISVLQENLDKALGIVIKAIDQRPPLPSLGHVLLEAEDSRLRVVASNLQMSLTVWIGAHVIQPGAITLPAKTFTDLVGRFAKERVDMTLDSLTNTVHYECGDTTGAVKGLAATEYPPVKQSDEAGFVVSSRVLKEMIEHTAYAAAKEDNRPILTGVYTEIETDVLTLAAADGYRLAVRTTQLDETALEKKSMVIPAKVMTILAGMITDDKQPISVSLPSKERIVTFRLPNMDVSCQIVDGIFPQFAAIIPQRHTTQAVASVDEWLRKAHIAEIFARDDAHTGTLVITPPQGLPGIGTEGSVNLMGRGAERGNADNEFAAQVEGEKVEMNFDIRLIIALMSSIEDADCVVFECNGADSPGVFRIQGRDDLVSVLMPMTH